MKRMIEDSVLFDIGDALRKKHNTDRKYQDNEMAQAVRDISSPKDEQEKTIDITENGTTEILPDENKALSKVTVNVDVPSDEVFFTPYGSMYTKHVEIPETVTVILTSLYEGASNLRSIIIPASVTNVRQSAFKDCHFDTLIIRDGCTASLDWNALAGFTYMFINENGYLYLPSSLSELRNMSKLNTSYGTTKKPVTVEIGNNWSLQGLDFSGFALSVECMINIFNSLADRTGLEAYPIIIGPNNILELSEEDIAIPTNKNWTIA